ncbi:MAG: low-specificity L-threonine aldolase [Waddliaceae bacterium]|nr:low-specificity L-threonine aldolase [Waddliaceae bacterium]
MPRIIDLRSDTVTKPTESMKQAMYMAEVGDDVMGEDPTVNELEAYAASITGKESALFFPTATQSNLAAIMAFCQRGDEYIVGDQAHCYRFEAGGAAVLGSVQPQPIPFESNGTLDLAKVKKQIKMDDPHFARTRLLCLENTFMGKALPVDYLIEAGNFAKEHGLALHMDGARACNAAVASSCTLEELLAPVDSVTICLSKGLGCPAGALLCASKKVIILAKRARKILGGGMRQAGILAAAGLYALKNHIDRLAEDHRLAQVLADQLKTIEHPDLLSVSSSTNMVFLEMSPEKGRHLQAFLSENGIKILSGYLEHIRLVIHMDTNEADVLQAAEIISKFFSESFVIQKYI